MDTTLRHIHPAPGRIILLEAPPSQARVTLISEFVQRTGTAVSRTWQLEAQPQWQGPWSGLRQWLCSLLPSLKREAPQLLARYALELALIIPELRREIPVNPHLATMSPGVRLRTPPDDRAYRIAHGVIDLLEAWRGLDQQGPWLVTFDSFDRASALVQYFMAQLMRRRGTAFELTLLLSVAPGQADKLSLPFSGDVTILRTDLPADPPRADNPLLARVEVQRLVELVGDDPIEQEIHRPQIVQLWLQSDRPDAALPWLTEALATYVAQGLFQDALSYGQAAMDLLERNRPDDISQRFAITVDLFDIYVSMRMYDQAQRVVESFMTQTEHPWYRFQGYYYLGVLWSKHKRPLDLTRAEAFIRKGLDALRRIDFPLEKRTFRQILLTINLAQILTQQGRRAEALLLLQKTQAVALKQLQTTPSVHRAVLLQKTAQVFAMSGFSGEAIQHLTEAIALDPHCAEYYHQRGKLRGAIGEWEAAYEDYQEAIRLSPPYAEVWLDLAECCRQLGRYSEAVRSFERARDLDPCVAAPSGGVILPETNSLSQ